jgi:NAD(P)-dependent dehydrogenase (short-subunit alcohol dehydrogenase family)
VLVTGGASGLGRAAALLFAAKGCSVCIADINVALMDETCRAIEGKCSHPSIMRYGST